MSEIIKHTSEDAEGFVAPDEVSKEGDDLDEHTRGLRKEGDYLDQERIQEVKGQQLAMLNEMLSPSYEKEYDGWSEEERNRIQRLNESRGGEAAGAIEGLYSKEQREALGAVNYGSSPYNSKFREAVERAISILSPDVPDADPKATVETYNQDAANKRRDGRESVGSEVLDQLDNAEWKDIKKPD